LVKYIIGSKGDKKMTQTITEKTIKPCFKHYGKTQSEQIKINQQGLEILKKWQQEDAQLNEIEIKKAQETWEIVKTIIDENRSRKFFS
jgi:hypothetical protein